MTSSQTILEATMKDSDQKLTILGRLMHKNRESFPVKGNFVDLDHIHLRKYY